ncbi:MAG: hypothetical protein J5509_11875 [Lachnospiraceae bacterium]|nr:hypothetical protein [Lachnospiraceae bacterium]
MKDSIILLKTLLLSTSQHNIYRHSTDKKRRRKVIASYIGLFCLYAMIVGYSIAMCIGYGEFGLIDSTPAMCAIVISALAFIFTFFKTNGYLFNFKEYDMLMSLPFESRTVAACKFTYMYIKSLPWYLSIALAMMIGYGIYAHPPVIVYLIWIVLSFLLPVIPMLLAAFLGFLIARISAGFRKTNLIQTVLTMVFIIFCFSLRFIIEALFREDKVEDTLQSISAATENAGRIYLPVKWFAGAITGPRVSDILLLAGVSILLFAIVFRIVGGSYRSINSALKSHAASKKYRMTGQKKRSVINAITFKEFKRLTGSTTYMTNGAIGLVLASLLAVVTLFIGFDKIVASVTQNAPFDYSVVEPAIPFIVYFFVGMMASTACSPSLEGKNYWILQSLPIEKTTIYKGKMLFNMYMTVPFMVFAILCMSISAHVPVSEMILYMILGVALCAFSTTWGCVCGIKHMKLDWENEIEVIKQGTNVAIYMFPNMIAVMGLTVLVVFLGMRMNHLLLTAIMILIAALLAAICYVRALALAKRT